MGELASLLRGEEQIMSALAVFYNCCDCVILILTLFPIVVLILTENSNKKAGCLILCFVNSVFSFEEAFDV